MGVLVLVLIGGIAFLVSNTKGHEEATAGVPAEVTDADWILGTSTAKVTIIEYSDLQCPACASYETILKPLIAKYPNDVRLVYRHFPLKQIHPNAVSAGVASEAAGRQGKFWEMHDMLFDRQDIWGKSVTAKDLYVAYAKELGLNEAQFVADMNDKVLEQKLQDSFTTAVTLGLSGTPSFFLNGELIDSPRSFSEFEALIQAELAK